MSTPSDIFAAALAAHDITSEPTTSVRDIRSAVVRCTCCTRRDSASAKRRLTDAVGDAVRCWVCWSADAVRHPDTGEVRFIADRVRNNWLPASERVGYPNADAPLHGLAPVCFWHNDPNDVAAGILTHRGAARRALHLVSGGSFTDLL